MKTSTVTAIGLYLLLSSGCTPDKKKPSTNPDVGVCSLDTTKPQPMRRAGTARVRLQGMEGMGLDVDEKVPCLCGPMFNADAPRIGIKAGDGLYFELCMPHGAIVLSAQDRAAGQQTLHGTQGQQGGAEVSFTRAHDSVYSSRGLASDRIAFSGNLWRAQARVELHDVTSDRTINAYIDFDCRDGQSP